MTDIQDLNYTTKKQSSQHMTLRIKILFSTTDDYKNLSWIRTYKKSQKYYKNKYAIKLDINIQI